MTTGLIDATGAEAKPRPPPARSEATGAEATDDTDEHKLGAEETTMARRKPKRWLFKSEPDEFSFEDLCGSPGGTARWDGVRSYQARNVMRQVRVGDRVLFYHSSTSPPHVAGLAEVVRDPYPDPTQFDPDSPYHDPDSPADDPRWVAVDVRAVEALARPVSLAEIRANGRLKQMVLVNKSRLSVQPVTEGQWRQILDMAAQGSGIG